MLRLPLLGTRNRPQALAVVPRLLRSALPLHRASLVTAPPAREHKPSKRLPTTVLCGDKEGVVPWTCVRRWLYHAGKLSQRPPEVIERWTDVTTLHSTALAASGRLTLYEVPNLLGVITPGLSLSQLRILRTSLEEKEGISREILDSAWRRAHLFLFDGAAPPHTFADPSELQRSVFGKWVNTPRTVNREAEGMMYSQEQ
ncbi:hypothetical protein JCM8097_003001 [Rhodosporidiobolus ruineniae]